MQEEISVEAMFIAELVALLVWLVLLLELQ